MTYSLPADKDPATLNAWGVQILAAINDLDTRVAVVAAALATANATIASHTTTIAANAASITDLQTRLAAAEATLLLKATQANLAAVAFSGKAADIIGGTVTFRWNATTGKPELVGDVPGTAAALTKANLVKKFAQPSANNPLTVTSPATPTFAYGDEWDQVGP